MDEFQRRVRLKALFDAHAGAVRAYARRRIGATFADDTVSEVFAIAWRRLDDVPDQALPWLLGCARRVPAHQHRRARRDLALVDRLQEAAPGPAAIAGWAGGDDALATAFVQLRERDREILLLIAWEGLDTSQAAAVLGCSRNVLAVRLHRGRRRLAAALDPVEARESFTTPPNPAKETSG